MTKVGGLDVESVLSSPCPLGKYGCCTLIRPVFSFGTGPCLLCCLPKDVKRPSSPALFAIVTFVLPKQERHFIRGLRRARGWPRNWAVVRGIGDDCAVLKLRPDNELLATTDLCIENVHFRREWHPPRSVGHRCLARGLSDIAAMGGEPVSCFLSLGLPADLSQSWVDGFLSGFEGLTRRFDVELAGGDTSAAKEIVADIIVLGEVPRGKAVLRSGAHPGDRIYVTGHLGASGATLERLYSGTRVRPSPSSRHFYPQPRVEAGQWLRRRNLATSMIDISDGLSVDLCHLCEESRVSALINAETLPVAKGARVETALHGGDDYELLFTARAGSAVPAKIRGVPVTEIGTVQQVALSPLIILRDAAGRSQKLKAGGWQHFAKKK